ncbi:protein archease [Thermogymnomonas acidicola]|uniref:Protein archease n=1 Tax=Thermogymnomonas acidicola TaxID=399579 RepID=A0AA37BSI3_9ARCH|nr:protein archease [Thermogymnomonas acidicola]
MQILLRYEIVDHTADVAVRVFGNTYEELLANSVYAAADLFYDTANLYPVSSTIVDVEGHSVEDVFVEALSRVIYLFETTSVLYFGCDVLYLKEGWSASLELSGSPLPEGAEVRYALKAPTYHMIEISPEKGYAFLVFDV